MIERRAEPAGGLLDLPALFGVVQRMEAGAQGEAGHVAAGVQVEHDMHARPDVLADEGRDPVRDPRQGRRLAGALDEGAVQVHAVVGALAACRRGTPTG